MLNDDNKYDILIHIKWMMILHIGLVTHVSSDSINHDVVTIKKNGHKISFRGWFWGDEFILNRCDQAQNGPDSAVYCNNELKLTISDPNFFQKIDNAVKEAFGVET